ncbi:MAG: 16S rRNA (adenine(1518)-N(6)/adenine(1519)-N(6))-dimethyltransferase RsmA [Candidatus Promineifilaceae bacterium]
MHPKDLLKRFEIEPKKSLGQNFLFDPSVLQRIVSDADIEPHDHVLEIGPGLGALTTVLADSAEKVVAVELDNRLLPILDEQFADYPNIELIHGDILKQNPSELFDRPYKVVANVPYYITGAILRHLLSAENKPSTIVLTVQKEVATRMTASPKKMSLLAVSVQFYGRTKVVRTLAAGAFWPRPKVDSAVVRIDVQTGQPLAANEANFFRTAKIGFSQKRKQLKNNLRGLGLSDTKTAQAFEQAGVAPTRRAQTLEISEWVALTNALYS